MNDNSGSEWNEEAKSAFNEFRKRKRCLPSPSDSDNKVPESSKKFGRYDSRDKYYNSRTSRKNIVFDNNRGLSHDADEFLRSPNQNIRNSTFSDKFMSIDNITEVELDQTEVVCDDAEKKLAIIQEMISTKQDPYEILHKIVEEMASNYKKCREMIQKVHVDNISRCAKLNEQCVSLENDIIEKINYVHQKNEQRFKSLEMTHKCSYENSIVWLSFTDPNELEKLRIIPKSELLKEVRKIMLRMNIWTNTTNRTIVDAFIQKVAIKTTKGFENELIMGIKFLNSPAANDIKRLVMKYSKEMFLTKNFDSIRYTLRDNWSSEIWKLLRVCYDLAYFKFIEKTHICDTGIIVTYKSCEKPGSENSSNNIVRMLIRTENDLDDLRKSVQDTNSEIPTYQFYNGEYFKLSREERKKLRDDRAHTVNVNGKSNECQDIIQTDNESVPTPTTC